MSWGIDFTADIFLPRQHYTNTYEVQLQIDELKECNQRLREKMLMMICGGKNSVALTDCEGNECDAVDVLHTRFSELLELYDENNEQIGNLHYYKEYLENNKDGDS